MSGGFIIGSIIPLHTAYCFFFSFLSKFLLAIILHLLPPFPSSPHNTALHMHPSLLPASCLDSAHSRARLPTAPPLYSLFDSRRWIGRLGTIEVIVSLVPGFGLDSAVLVFNSLQSSRGSGPIPPTNHPQPSCGHY